MRITVEDFDRPEKPMSTDDVPVRRRSPAPIPIACNRGLLLKQSFPGSSMAICVDLDGGERRRALGLMRVMLAPSGWILIDARYS